MVRAWGLLPERLASHASNFVAKARLTFRDVDQQMGSGRRRNALRRPDIRGASFAWSVQTAATMAQSVVCEQPPEKLTRLSRSAQLGEIHRHHRVERDAVPLSEPGSMMDVNCWNTLNVAARPLWIVPG